ncbi:hypothetical protein SUGI_0205800 [Cryptomeria japonica]|nr:hypothetical protein SUGI_0205800 [Cryptomeria japonica]
MENSGFEQNGCPVENGGLPENGVPMEKITRKGTLRLRGKKMQQSPLRIRVVSDDEQRNQPKEEKDYPDPAEEDPDSSSED